MRTAQDGPEAGLTLDALRTRATISVEEAAEVLGVGRSGAYAAARSGELPTIRIGRRLLVPTSRLLRLLGDGADRSDAT